ncbi:MAG: bifunctional anthranilate synthase component I family protein/class IV aminotransferase [Propionicimonas sp.]|uniref:bifunctional chorismate-binding protein/class IV aminotransferase n=1 Tax=Propionicimonas sp. TaxID=1955623 RepID=UPI002B2199B8|nr:bifunctional anthranilate synthase component I family protein/class IV aminotransferase [Propionicimonas sp.]MEA4945372.1 bifunctional anthranilate synthase component I family protein/class IV aminotransferase [Propionicimonas sp.]
MTSAHLVRAAFDLPLDPRDRDGPRLAGAFLTEPTAVLATSAPHQVPAVVAAAEQAARAGHWVVGGLTYEAGGAWDAAQRTRAGTGELARFEVFSADPVGWPAASASPVLDWFVSGRFAVPDPAAAITEVQERIAAGDCYQVNLTSRMATLPPPGDDLYSRFRGLASTQPQGYAVFLRGAGVASVSPELFFHARPDGRVTTQPMKGTAPAGTPPEQLRGHPKEQAENLMIVDLLRNDLGRVCLPGTVRVDGLFDLLELPTVWQLVSTVSGQARPGTGLADLFAALFPCGSVTGAPKIRAMEVIAGLESQPRGWYCGALGVLRPGGEAIFNVAIRTVEQRGSRLECGVGSGIVADSRPSAELAEWRAKTRFLGGRPLAALETLRLVDGRYPRLAGHLDRLARADAVLGLGADLAEAAAALERLRAAHPSGAWRVRLTAGDGSTQAVASRCPETPSPVTLAVADRPLDTVALAPVIGHKTSWRQHYEALYDGRPAGAFDVICHTTDGQVTEATRGNLAFLLDRRWVTPPASLGLLPGVERAARLSDGTLVEAAVGLTDLGRVEQVAYLNALRGWCPVVLPDSGR